MTGQGDLAGVIRRLDDLERIEAIKALKHRYLRACDAKDAEEFRACFVAGEADIDYGPRVGKHDTADSLTAIYIRIARHQVDDEYVILDMHHALHPDIRLVSETEATGSWTLRFRQVNLTQNTELVSCIEYDDGYVVEDGEWKIAKCHSHERWSVTKPLPEGTIVHQGNLP